MNHSANNWASPDQSKNMTLADADRLGNQLAGALSLQFSTKFVRTTTGETVSEEELRGNQFISPLPVNLFAKLAGPGSNEFNIADFRASLKHAATADDPTTALLTIMQQALPLTNAPSQLTRMPAIQQLIADALSRF
jgi:hypothetical protein